MGAAIGDEMYLLGGLDASGVSSADIYRISPLSGRVAIVGQLAVPTHGAAAVLLGGRILVFGGADFAPDDLVQAFDPATGATTVIGHMPSDRADFVAALVGGSAILLAGFSGLSFVSDVWATRDGRSFSVLGKLAEDVRYPAVAAVGTTIYLFGGLVAGGEYDGTYSTTVQSFDVATGRSAVVGHLPIPLGHARAAVLNGELLVFGGWTPSGASSVIWRFDPVTGAVTRVGTLPEAVADEATAAIGNRVYFASGLGSAQQPLLRVGSLSVVVRT
jgi:hypothetical protein